MPSDLITVVTCTVGDSSGRLEHLLWECRRFTELDYRQIVCDDGTLDEGMVNWQRHVCRELPHVEWVQNPGPTYGISYNFNHALSLVKTPWVMLVEDGLRPSRAWLETAHDAVRKIGDRTWNGRRVGMMGCVLLEDWTLAIGQAIPGELSPMDFFHQRPLAYDRFYGPWNDGFWSWPRLMPGFLASIQGDTSSWTDDLAIFRDMMRPSIENWKERLAETEQQQRWQKWHAERRWPAWRAASCGWYPGPVLLINLDLWNQVGRMRDGCTFFEGHLGVRMGMAGHLCLVVETQPYLHQRSQGFRMAHLAAEPRHHAPTTELFLADFGYNHMDAPNVLATGVVSIEEQADINRQLADVQLDLPREWENYL